jgi:hypothetical protein
MWSLVSSGRCGRRGETIVSRLARGIKCSSATICGQISLVNKVVASCMLNSTGIPTFGMLSSSLDISLAIPAGFEVIVDILAELQSRPLSTLTQ